jgi:hypothetical protein
MDVDGDGGRREFGLRGQRRGTGSDEREPSPIRSPDITLPDLERLGLSESDLKSLPCGDPRKVAVAGFIHRSTTTSQGCTPERPQMKSVANVNQRLSHAKGLQNRKSSQQNQSSSQDLLTDPFVVSLR